ncbi:MAG: magnesium transporter CorA family protein [Hyphomicrobium sp.]
MLNVYNAVAGRLSLSPDGDAAGADAVWIDLLNPTDGEDAEVEKMLGIDVPTRSEMREIEASNRFYTENGASYMTAIVLHHSSRGVPMISPITFILSGKRLVTVRYAEPKAFEMYVARAAGKLESGCAVGAEVMMGLVEMLIEREADLIERVQDDVESMAPQVFGQKGSEQPSRTRRLDVLLRNVGKAGDVVSRAQESATSLNRLLLFAGGAMKARKDDPPILARLEGASADIASLTESLRFLSGRTAFLLDATLGMISTEQNQIIKLFSVMAVILMPPTLIASIYGMNFEHMPELKWLYGYPYALILMVVAAIAPYLYFRHRGWF